MRKPTMQEIKQATKAKCPYFFDRKTMKFFNQTMRDFKVIQTEGKTFIAAPSQIISGTMWTVREFTGNDLIMCDEATKRKITHLYLGV